MFPIITNQRRETKVEKPKIETIGNYTKLSADEFLKLLAIRTKDSSLFESITYITNWYGFDNLEHDEKIDFVRRIETPEYYNLIPRVKRMIKRLRNGRGNRS